MPFLKLKRKERKRYGTVILFLRFYLTNIQTV